MAKKAKYAKKSRVLHLTIAFVDCLLLCCILYANAFAATYYVDPSGSDSSPGTKNKPFKTLQKAAYMVKAGDTVHVQNGTYSGFYSVNSGAPSNPITFRSDGNNVVVNARNTKTNDNINIEGTDHVTIEGFIVRNGGRAGIRVVNAWGVVIRDNTVGPNTTWGIFTGFAPQVQILNNKTFNSSQEHGIYVSNSKVANDNPIIRGNETYGNYMSGIQVNGDCEVGGDGVISGGLIENNIVRDNGAKGLSLISMSDSIVQNNLIYNNGARGIGAGGIHLTGQPGCNLPSNRNLVVNNTIVEQRITGIRLSGGPVNNVIFNNLIISKMPLADEGGGNSIDRSSNLTRNSHKGLFVNADIGDYNLQQSSAAIDKGKAAYSGRTAPSRDLIGNGRPQEKGYDIGSYEYGITVKPTIPRK